MKSFDSFEEGRRTPRWSIGLRPPRGVILWREGVDGDLIGAEETYLPGDYCNVTVTRFDCQNKKFGAAKSRTNASP